MHTRFLLTNQVSFAVTPVLQASGTIFLNPGSIPAGSIGNLQKPEPALDWWDDVMFISPLKRFSKPGFFKSIQKLSPREERSSFSGPLPDKILLGRKPFVRSSWAIRVPGFVFCHEAKFFERTSRMPVSVYGLIIHNLSWKTYQQGRQRSIRMTKSPGSKAGAAV